jgi:hypothetical protein
MLVVDLMHEFELGVWKALFIHLLRILLAVKGLSLHELDHRYLHPLDRLLVLLVDCDLVFGRSQLLVVILSADSDLMFPS